MISEDERRRVEWGPTPSWQTSHFRLDPHPLHIDALVWAISLFGDRVTDREGKALAMRVQYRWPYSVIGRTLGISGVRAAQIIRTAKRKLRGAMQHSMALERELRHAIRDMQPYASAMPEVLDRLFGRTH